MPVQQQMSSFAKSMGGRVAQANAEHHDAPVDTGNRRLPAGISGGVAKLSTMYTKSYEDDKNGPGTKGQAFFRCSAIVMSPETHNGEKIAGQVTSQVIPLCDMPAKGQRKAVSFSENWYEFQNIFKLLGVAPCPETPTTDPTGQRTEAYFFAAMKMLVDRVKTNPVYVGFSTRGWTPPSSPAQPKPEEMVFETWHGLAEWSVKHDPAAGVQEAHTNNQPPPSHTPPPTQVQAPVQAQPTPLATTLEDSIADTVAALVETAMNDPEGATEDGQAASSKLEEMAWAAGWTKEQTASPPAPYSNDWAGVGDMAITAPTGPIGATGPVGAIGTTSSPHNAAVVVGSKWKFAKRTKDGERLKNNNGEMFPPQEVEVATVDQATGTCTVKMKDGWTWWTSGPRSRSPSSSSGLSRRKRNEARLR